MSTLYLPHSQRLEVFCPSCDRPGTEWHPAERWGRCHLCGQEWRTFPFDREPSDIEETIAKLPERVQRLIAHIDGEFPSSRMRSRVATLMARGEPVPWEELRHFHSMQHKGQAPR